MQSVSIPVPPLESMRKELYIILPAAGTGSRMGLSDSKQFLEIAGVPVLARTLLAFSDFASRSLLNLHAIVVTSEDNISRVEELCSRYEISFVEKVVLGGDSRQESVACGVKALSTLALPPKEKDIVFIHDGARCLVDYETIRNCVVGGMKYEVCVAATPCKNTIKCAKAEENNKNVSRSDALVDKTLDRSLLYEVQTPQVFQYEVLTKVCKKAEESGIVATDDTALAEALGIPVRLIPCSYNNIKITTPEDVAIAEFILNQNT